MDKFIVNIQIIQVTVSQNHKNCVKVKAMRKTLFKGINNYLKVQCIGLGIEI